MNYQFQFESLEKAKEAVTRCMQSGYEVGGIVFVPRPGFKLPEGVTLAMHNDGGD